MSSYDEERTIHTRRDRSALRIPEAAKRDRHSSVADRSATSTGGRGPVAGPALGVNHILALQRSIGNAAVAQLLANEEEPLSPVRNVIGKGGGQALDTNLRQTMESRLGHDFSDVRLHTGSQASDSARSVGAKAYTVGHEIVLGPGHGGLDTPTGQRTLAHELTHVVQQRSGPVDGTPAAGGIKLSDPSDRFEREAERVAEHAMSKDGAAEILGSANLGVQRMEEEDEEEGHEG